MSAQDAVAQRKAPRADLGRGGRIVAGALALVWLAAGVAAIIYGVRRHVWIAVLLGIPAIFYSGIWIAVARAGRRLQWPRRQSRHSGPKEVP